MANTDIVVYGADWCGDTQLALRHLRSKATPFEYVNIDEDSEAAAKVIEWNQGKRKIPVLTIGGKTLLSPSSTDIDRAIADGGLQHGAPVIRKTA
ncbi:MAG: hypothetical protein NVS9B15_04520 [Acidobacteriaceae bacterium]